MFYDHFILTIEIITWKLMLVHCRNFGECDKETKDSQSHCPITVNISGCFLHLYTLPWTSKTFAYRPLLLRCESSALTIIKKSPVKIIFAALFLLTESHAITYLSILKAGHSGCFQVFCSYRQCCSEYLYVHISISILNYFLRTYYQIANY